MTAPPVDLGTQPLFPIDQTEFEAALAADHVNVEETARRLDREQVEASVELISRAERIVLCGTDQMAFFASYLRHLLMLLDLRCRGGGQPEPGGPGQARPHRRADACSWASPPGARTRWWCAR